MGNHYHMEKKVYRILFAFVVILSAVFLVGTNADSASGSPYSEFREQSKLPDNEREQLAPPHDGITVVTSHRQGDIVALYPNGTLLYHNGTRDGYWDVDPSPEGEMTVMYSATDKVRNSTVCEPVDDQDYCIRQIIERANLSTGETTVLYSRIDPRYHSSEWHDVDRINESHYIVADMHADEVFIVNVSNGTVTWEWNLQNHLSLTTGGPYPENWAHLNDVEVLGDGRVMISPRNQDQVLFIDRKRGVVDDWTLGTDDRHSILYEQHNPDYIPRSNGGPAVVIADSENNRIVEFQRTSSGERNQTWVWQDRQLQWPRDADRLPNGNTLITDTQGDRVLEVDEQGDIVWSLDVPVAYEAERLDTGDESTEGASAERLNLTSQSLASDRTSSEQSGILFEVKDTIKGLFPNKVINGIGNTTPVWMGFYDLIVFLGGSLTVILWLGLEIKWADFKLQKPITRG
jgi:hypothetical protein